ncbi:DUF6428 family protein [Tenacibaculum sp. SG-28]|uniref:DUF6428 family protein n=1 Tax=Tenacibaculum sp. SG-28 TaxID=754426 RepID=UPI000CF4CF80|nr:DUF6428 family protein [Tenacibaculum sp. SG-28]PQJ23033.1 hypothetical protein BSU00_01845 [Tenacibaculum sp. SG-28]
MKVSEIKNHLKKLSTIAFELPNGELVPKHFHVTEVGKVHKHFIDCGGTIREEEVVNFQLWSANDYNHRLHPEKLLQIIELSEKTLGIKDVNIEVEYQGETIGKYELGFNGKNFTLGNKATACLAEEQCGITPKEKPKIRISALGNQRKNECDPNSGCC